MDRPPQDARPAHDPSLPSRPTARNRWDKPVPHSYAPKNNYGYESRSNPTGRFPAIPPAAFRHTLPRREFLSTHYILCIKKGGWPSARNPPPAPSCSFRRLDQVPNTRASRYLGTAPVQEECVVSVLRRI